MKQLSSSNNVTLSWVPAHTGIEGNEKADSLARQGAENKLIGPEPYVGISRTTIKARFKLNLNNERTNYWNHLRGLGHSKRFIKGTDSNRSKFILSLPKNKIRLFVGFLTGHYPLKARLKLFGIMAEDICRFCELEPEKADHLLCNCQALARTRLRTLGKGFLDPEDYKELDAESIMTFLMKIYVKIKT